MERTFGGHNKTKSYRCEVDFSQNELEIFLGNLDGKPLTLKELFGGEYSFPIKTRQEALTYLAERINFAQGFKIAFGDKRYSQEIEICEKARNIISEKN